MLTTMQKLKAALASDEFMRKKVRRAAVDNSARETEVSFVRSIGSRAKRVIFSGCCDNIGLIVHGDKYGFVVTLSNGRRIARAVCVISGRYAVVPGKEVVLTGSVNNHINELTQWVK